MCLLCLRSYNPEQLQNKATPQGHPSGYFVPLSEVKVDIWLPHGHSAVFAMLISTVLLQRKKKKKDNWTSKIKVMYSDTTLLLQLKCILATPRSNFLTVLHCQYNKAHMERELNAPLGPGVLPRVLFCASSS